MLQVSHAATVSQPVTTDGSSLRGNSSYTSNSDGSGTFLHNYIPFSVGFSAFS